MRNHCKLYLFSRDESKNQKGRYFLISSKQIMDEVSIELVNIGEATLFLKLSALYQLIYLLLNLNFDEASEFELWKLKAKSPQPGVEKQPPLFVKSGWTECNMDFIERAKVSHKADVLVLSWLVLATVLESEQSSHLVDLHLI